MTDEDMTKDQLLEEVNRLRQENARLKAPQTDRYYVEDGLRALLEAAFEGIMIHEKGILLDANDQYYKMFGYEPEELLGKQVLPMTVMPETLDPAKRRTSEDGITTYEITGRRKDGSTFLMEVTGKLMNYRGRQVRGVAVLDISKRREVENALRESEEMLRFLSTRLFEVIEEERSRLSKELHDQLGHDLVLMKSWLRSIERQLTDDQQQLKQECSETINSVDQIIENVRRLSRDLMPSILEDLGLIASIRWIAENFSRQHHMPVHLDLENIDHLFPREVQITLYRIVQETLTNIAKHAAATEVWIKVNKEEEHIVFLVKDNGKGFEFNKVKERKFEARGLGLTAMNERMHILGGQFDVSSRTGDGTEIKFKIPIGEKEV